MREAAKRVRDTYIAERRVTERMRTLHESGYLPGKHWDGDENRAPVWPKLAEFMLRKGVDPVVYVKQAFRLCRAAGKTPMPNQLTSSWLYEQFAQWWPGYGDEVLRALNHQREYAKAAITAMAEAPELSREQCWNLVLLDDHAPLCALFRYCLAVEQKLLPIARQYRDEAVQQYLFSPKHYDKHWAAWIPERLKKEADRVRKAVKGA